METIQNLPSRYTILSRLGEGGIGQVYKILDSIKNQICALKIINRAEPRSKDTLIKEFKILSNFQHPNLVRVYDFGFLTSDVPYFTMEYVDGSDLKDFLASESNLIFLSQIIKEILSALCYLHEKGTIHGDIKPENVMIIRHNEDTISVKLLDFGLAAYMGQKRNGISGTLRFLAPEVVSSKHYSTASDLYALGLTLYEVISKERVPLPTKISDGFLKTMYSNILKTLSSADIKNPSSTASFILNITQLDLEDRPVSPKAALQAFSLLCEERDDKPIPDFEEIFVGRKKELNAINNFLDDTASPKKLLIVEGIQGMGKKSILRKILKKSQVEGRLVLDLFDDKYKTSPLEHFISDVADNLPENKGSAFKKAHEKLLQSTHLDMDIRYARTSKKDHSLVIYDNIIKYIHELSLERTVLIFIPDIERFSEDFIRFLAQLLHETRVLESRIFLIISRNSNIPLKYDTYNTISKKTVSSSIKVDPLTKNELSILLKEYFDSMIFSRSELNDIILHTHCIPLVVVELMRHLISSNTIKWSGNRWFFDKNIYDNTYIPKSTEELILSKLKLLNQKEKKVLRILAVYNGPLHLSLLKCISNMDEIHIIEIVKNLSTKQLVQINNRVIEFINPIHYQLIAKRISQRTRIEINNKIACQLIVERPNDSAKIAHHSIEGNMPDKALEYGLRAVDEMVSKYEFYSAHNILKKIKKLLSKKGSKYQLIEIVKRMAPLDQKTGHPFDSIYNYKLLADNAPNSNDKALYTKQIALIHYVLLGHTEKAISHFNDALSMAKFSNNFELESEILMELGRLVGEKGIYFTKRAANIVKNVNNDLYVKALSRILYLNEMAGKTNGLSSIYNQIERLINNVNIEIRKDILFNLYMVHFYRSNYETAKQLIEEKIKIEETTDDPIGKIYSLSSLGGIYYVQGDFYKQIQILKKALLIARKYNHFLMALTIISNMLIAYRYLAEYGESLKLFERANSIISDNKITQLNEIYLLKPTFLFLLTGKETENEFKKYLNTTKNRAKKFNNTIALGHCYLIHSKYHYQNLNSRLAFKNAFKALEYFKNADDRDDMVDAYAHMALYLLESGETKTASENAEQAQSIYDVIQCKYLESYLQFVRAAAARANRAGNTEELQTRALRTSKKMGTRETTWQIQREIALYYIDIGKLDEALSYYSDTIETIKQITESISDEKLKMSYLSVPFRKRVFDEIKNLKKQIH